MTKRRRRRRSRDEGIREDAKYDPHGLSQLATHGCQPGYVMHKTYNDFSKTSPSK
jgi:hypothetical protein